MRENDFRRMALGMDGAVEGAHMGHPDFRVNNRIFATLHHDREFGMVALTPDQQEQFMRAHPDAFAPESGAWGRAGSTRVQLALDRYAAQNVNFVPVVSPHSGPRRAERAKEIETTSRGAPGISRGGAPWLVQCRCIGSVSESMGTLVR